MRTLIKVLAGLVALAVVGVGIAAGALWLINLPAYGATVPELSVDQAPDRVARGRHLATMVCTTCHYDTNSHTLQGRPLAAPWGLGSVHTGNLTAHPDAGVGGWTDGDLAFALRTGIHPRTKQLMLPLMPRFPRMSTADLEAIIAFLRSDDPLLAASDEVRPDYRVTLRAKWAAFTDWEPYAYPRQVIPETDVDDPIAYGGYLVDVVIQCHRCHSEAVGNVDLIDARNTPGYLGGGAPFAGTAVDQVQAANISPHASGIADWTEDDLRRALVDGFRPDGTVLRWPMTRLSNLSTREVEAIYAYLRTASPVDKTVERGEPRRVGDKADAGLHTFQKYGCVHCHGQFGEGLVDLRGVDEAYPTDEDLTAFLRDPTTAHPVTVMPAWDGVVAEEDYPRLCEISRRLSREAEADFAARNKD